MINNKLKGIWSVDCMYGPGAQSDELLIFLDNGFGWIEMINWGSMSIETFEWTVDQKSELTIKGLKIFSNYERTRKSKINLIDVELKISNEITSTKEMMEVMTLSQPIILNIQKFGLETRDVDERYFERRMEVLKS